jgi:hypothetical protein
MRSILVFSILLTACSPSPPPKLSIVNEENIIIDIAGTQLYIVPISISKGTQCFMGGNKTHAYFHCDFVRPK